MSSAIRLQCGPLTAVLDGADLFDIRWGGLEVAQRIYVAVRDESWNTIPPVVRDARVDVATDRTRVTMDVVHSHGDIAYEWTGCVDLHADGRLSFEMNGRARADFSYCKIGFNVHHGLRTHAGRAFRCRSLGGLVSGTFGADLVPQLVREGSLTAMTPHYDRLEIDLGDNRIDLEFAGDRFEMQDHRNWLDANWKSYGTPLEEGFPMRISAGEELYQRVGLTVHGHPTAPAATALAIVEDAARVEAEPGSRRVPRLGYLLTEIPNPDQIARLRALRPAHLRVDLHQSDDLAVTIERALAVSASLGCRLEVALFVSPPCAVSEAAAFSAALAAVRGGIDRVLVLAETTGFSAFRGACPPEVVRAVRSALSAHGLDDCSVVAGTDQFFVDINRDRPVYDAADGLVFAANPQVHACDDRSIMQNAQAVADVVAFARRLYPNLSIVLSPFDLIGANGPFPAGPAGMDGAPANVDARQRTGFCAAWTLAALSAAAQAGVSSVTSYELVGPRGLMDEASFPVLDLLEAVVRHAADDVLPMTVDDPDRLAVLAFGGVDGPIVLVANLTPEPLVATLPWGEPVRLGPYAVVRSSRGRTEPIG